jgi:hypothetical protein
VVIDRDLYDPVTQDEGSGDSCDEDEPEYDETTESDLTPPSPSRPKKTGIGTVLGRGLRYGRSAITLCNTVTEIPTHIIPTPTSYKLAMLSPQAKQWSEAMDN